MTTQAQLDANRQNAQKSTGPKTEEGKTTVAQNALKHGLTAAAPVIAGEDLAAYEQFRRQLSAELLPKGPMESMLAERVIELSWRLKRAGRLQVGTYDALTADQTDGNSATLSLGRIAINDFSSGKVLDRLLMHECRIERSLYKTMLELQRLQFIRTKYQSLLYDGADYDNTETEEILQQQQTLNSKNC